MTPVEERIDHGLAEEIAKYVLIDPTTKPVDHETSCVLARAYLDLLPATEPAQPEEERWIPPPALDPEGRCLVCGLFVERDELAQQLEQTERVIGQACTILATIRSLDVMAEDESLSIGECSVRWRERIEEMIAPHPRRGSRSIMSARTSGGELLCDRCGQNYVVWFAPNEVWNDVMREGDRGKPDEIAFCCPTCFTFLAEMRGIKPTAWEVRPEGADPGGR